MTEHRTGGALGNQCPFSSLEGFQSVSPSCSLAVTMTTEHTWERTFQERNGTVTWYCRVCDRTVTRPHAYVDRGPYSPGLCVRAVRVPGDYFIPKRLPAPLDAERLTLRPKQVVDAAIDPRRLRILAAPFVRPNGLQAYSLNLAWLGDPAYIFVYREVVDAGEVDATTLLFVTLMLLKRYRGFETRLTGRDLNRVFPDGVPQPFVMKVKV